MKSILRYAGMIPILAASMSVFAQPSKPWTASLTSTGKPIGHIADITIENATDEPLTLDFPCVEIPSDGSHQRAIAMDFHIELAPRQSVVVDVAGYCMDVDLPAHSAGTPLPMPEAWSKIPPTPRIPPGADTKEVKPVTKGSAVDSLRTKGIAVGEDVYNPADHKAGDTVAHEPAHIVQPGKETSRTSQSTMPGVLPDIVRVAASLQEAGSIITPFGANPEKEREMVIQHVIWIAASPDDNSYTLQDICVDMQEQFEQRSGKPVSSLTPDEQAQFQMDISRLLDAVNTVGREAGIDAFQPTPISLPDSQMPRLPDGNYSEILSTVKATGTGLTTGHIADLTVSNPTDRPVTVDVGYGNAFIPSSGQYQPYIVPAIPSIPLDPGETKTVPVNGFCTDIHMPPVPFGVGMPDVRDWFSVPVSEITTPGINNMIVPTYITQPVEVAADIVHATTSMAMTRPVMKCFNIAITTTPTIPGTDHLIPTILQNVPTVTAPLLLDALNKITREYDSMKAQGIITTPFSGNPEKEREAVIQQTFWRYNSLLSGKKYEKEDFHDNTIKQFEQSTGQIFQTTPPQQQESVNKGVDNFWNTFEAVGVQAKVLSVPPTTPATLTSSVQDFWDGYDTGAAKSELPPTIDEIKQSDVEARCTCGSITFTLRNLTSGESFEIKSGRDTIRVNNITQEWYAFQDSTKKPIYLVVENVNVSCPCTASGNCNVYPRNSEFAQKDEDSVTVTSLTHSLDYTKTDGYVFKADFFQRRELKFKIHAWCKGDDCEVNKNCVESFTIVLRLKDE